MHDLQLVGFTTDRRGLIFRTTAGARAESYVVPVTAELLAALDELAIVDEVDDGEPRGKAPAVEVVPPAPRPTSALSVRDIQARLRAGEDPARIAADAGVDEEWIERFAPPVRAEQRRIVERALEAHLRRARGGPSAVPLRRAVGMAMAERGIAFTLAAFESAWSAHLLGQDRWAVDFAYRHRGDKTARWIYDAGADELTTSDRAAAQLGYVPQTAKVDDAGAPIDGVVGDPDATPVGAPAPPPRRRTNGASTRRRPTTATGSTGRGSTGAKKAGPRATTAKKAGRRAASTKRAPAKAVAKRARAVEKAPAGKAVAKRARAVEKAPAGKAVAKRARAVEKGPGRKAAPGRKAVAERTAAPGQAPAAKGVASGPARRDPASGAARPAPRRSPEPPAVAPDPDRVRVEGVAPATVVDGALRNPRPSRTVPDTGGRIVASRPGDVHLDEVPLAPAPVANGRPAALERVPDAPDVIDTTDPDRPGAPLPAPSGPVDAADARRARAAERAGPTVRFRDGSAVPVRRVEGNGAGRPPRPGPLRAR